MRWRGRHAGQPGFAWMDINLLPPQPRRRRHADALFLTAVGVLLMATLGGAVLAAELDKQVRSSQQLWQWALQDQQRVQTAVAVLQQQSAAALQSQSVAVAAGPQVRLQPLLSRVLAAVPSGVQVMSLVYTADNGGQIQLTGLAGNAAAVVAYQRNLAQVNGLAAVFLNQFGQSGNSSFSFQMTVSVKRGTASGAGG
ncbi:MAG: PilN domain-containing protein [Alicyclobacillus sp.]|nr:PilN domain-containing protein [Alicyclobacillus sp.]